MEIIILFNFLRNWGTLIIATIALIQVWIIALWKRYLKKIIVEVHETGVIEVGYNILGTTISLHGTLRTIGKDSFIRDIELSLVRLKDGSTHRLDWGFFGSEKITLGFPENHLELASGFMLLTSQPRRYNIAFVDTQLQNEIRPIIEKVRMEWSKTYSNANLESIRRFEEAADMRLNYIFQQGLEKLYEDFFNSKEHVDAYTSLDRHCYWEPGKYELQM